MSANGTSASILVVDDEDMIRSLLRLILVREGYEVMEAENGEDALSMVREEKPDLVLLDVMMPGMDGFTVCERLRQSPARDVPSCTSLVHVLFTDFPWRLPRRSPLPRRLRRRSR